MRISDWSSDVCSSDLRVGHGEGHIEDAGERLRKQRLAAARRADEQDVRFRQLHLRALGAVVEPLVVIVDRHRQHALGIVLSDHIIVQRSEEHTSELQSLMRISYAVFCLKKKKSLCTSPPSF